MTDAADKHAVMHGMFKIERKYPFSPERVFAGFADPQIKQRWFLEGDGWDIFEYRADFQIGGNEASRFRFNHGPDITNDTQYQDIVPDRRLVYSYRMTIAGEPISVSLVTVELLPDGAGTLMTYTEQGSYFGNSDCVTGREHGTRELLDKLERYLPGS